MRLKKIKNLWFLDETYSEFMIILSGSVGICTIMNKFSDDVDIERHPEDYSLVTLLTPGEIIGSFDILY